MISKTGLLPDYDALAVGDAIPVLEIAPVSRTTLALFAGASGDFNPIHIDIDFAKQAGFEDVFAHGMLVMAWLGRAITNWVPQSQLRSYGVRFAAITQVHDALRCEGEVREKFEQAGERRVRLSLSAADTSGERKLVGEAVIAL